MGSSRHARPLTLVPYTIDSQPLRILTLLEDPSGNQVGRAFEMKPGTAADRRPAPESVAVPFLVTDTP